jgi:ArsR family transcriptional regulator
MQDNGTGKKNPARKLDCVRMSHFFTIFAHETRMRIFCALENGPKPVTRIAEEAEISISNASQHLRLMRDRGAVVTERQGQSVYYRMADPRFYEAANLIRAALAAPSAGNEQETAQKPVPEMAPMGQSCPGAADTHIHQLITE